MVQGGTDELWGDSLLTIKDFAVANDCKKIIAYTTNDKITARAKQFGFNTSWTIIAKDI
jgi:hypothetical protein